MEQAPWAFRLLMMTVMSSIMADKNKQVHRRVRRVTKNPSRATPERTSLTPSPNAAGAGGALPRRPWRRARVLPRAAGRPQGRRAQRHRQ
eukprot:1533049-Prymnesium_polylepis.1